ncbi:hypothetical protein RHMOL_Rhmol10G0285200 [Rhododendron molle]|uniref:Uncharacterized protein n=1 Tax=Rhododendron molle TaxID=49168 RepID=A0ACC0M6Y8_RHOML|nr:hypothetical protein RHMOL_Rhmol10G0285200 [Rhododendron molle]
MGDNPSAFPFCSKRADLGPMMVQTKTKVVRTVEQCESSVFMSISEEMQRTTMTMQMKIEALQKEIDSMQMRNGGKMNWNYLFGLLFSVLCHTCVAKAAIDLK